MIGFLKGTLVSKHPPALTVDVGGVGYELEAPMSTFYRLPESGKPLTLLTHLSNAACPCPRTTTWGPGAV